MTTGWRRLALGLLAVAWASSGQGACRAVGARYVPRSTVPSPTIRYALTILPLPRGVAIVAERYRFALFDRRSGRLLSRVDLDTVCGNGRAPCQTWPPGDTGTRQRGDSFFTSTVIRLNADFSPARDWQAAQAILFPAFSENDWATPLTMGHHANVRYFTRPHVVPDLSEQTVWVRTACGPL